MEKGFLEGLEISEENIALILEKSNEEVNAMQIELATANTAINSLKGVAKDYDGVDIAKLKGDLETLQKKYDEDIRAVKLSAALDIALTGAKAWDAKAVKPYLDMSLIKLEGEKICGLEEQLQGIKETKKFLFDETSHVPVRSGMRQTGTEGGLDKKEEANEAFRSLLGKREE